VVETERDRQPQECQDKRGVLFVDVPKIREMGGDEEQRGEKEPPKACANERLEVRPGVGHLGHPFVV
jgi:hypothetical protein